MRITIPIAPKPQSRPRFNGNTKRAYELSDMTRYKEIVKAHCKSIKPKIIEKGAVMVVVTFYIEPPQYISKVARNRDALENERMYVEKKPDLDNYFKAVTDAAEGILFKNDGQIASVVMQKLYSMSPRTEIEVEEIECGL